MPRPVASDWWHLPLARYLRFQNPILQREVLRRLRLRRSSTTMAYIQMVIVLVGFGGAFLGVPTLVDQGWRQTFFWLVTYLWLVALLFTAAQMGAGSFARERELETWESLRLTPLSPREIIDGKLGASLLVCVYYSVPVLLVLLACVRGLTDEDTAPRDIALTQLLASCLIIGASTWCAVVWGMLISWFSKRVWIATAWTLFTLLFMLACPLTLAPLLNSRSLLAGMIQQGHPFAVLEQVQSGARFGQPLSATIYALTLFGIGCALLTILRCLMRKPREAKAGRLA